MKRVDLALQAPWVEKNPLGVQRMETKRENFGLSDAQKALFNRHWEMETIQAIKKYYLFYRVNLLLIHPVRRIGDKQPSSWYKWEFVIFGNVE